jgi:hypothetical protein
MAFGLGSGAPSRIPAPNLAAAWLMGGKQRAEIAWSGNRYRKAASAR